MFIKKIGSLTAWKQGLQAQRHPRLPPSRPPPPTKLLSERLTSQLCSRTSFPSKQGRGPQRSPAPDFPARAPPRPLHLGGRALLAAHASLSRQVLVRGKWGVQGSMPAANVRRKQGRCPRFPGWGMESHSGPSEGAVGTLTKTGGDSLSGGKVP